MGCGEVEGGQYDDKYYKLYRGLHNLGIALLGALDPVRTTVSGAGMGEGIMTTVTPPSLSVFKTVNYKQVSCSSINKPSSDTTKSSNKLVDPACSHTIMTDATNITSRGLH